MQIGMFGMSLCIMLLCGVVVMQYWLRARDHKKSWMKHAEESDDEYRYWHVKYNHDLSVAWFWAGVAWGLLMLKWLPDVIEYGGKL